MQSSTTNMVGFIDSLAVNMNDKKRTDVIYFDFSKAFDSVNHDLILKKLKHSFGIDGCLLNFIRQYSIFKG
jgi:retron-type reverse transcriptase